MTVKHATASAFVFSRFLDGWRLGLIQHPRLGRLMNPGGHVEEYESQGQAVIREVEEETGLRVRLLEPPAPPLPAGFPHRRVTPPWWIVEQNVPPDSHIAVPHVHIDHQYVAVAYSPDSPGSAAHAFAWYTNEELPGLSMFEDSKLLAKVLFTCIGEFADGGLEGVSLLRPFVAAAS